MEPGSRTPLAFGLTIAFVVALVAGALVAGEVSGGGDSSSLGPAGDPIPVLGPDALGETAPSDVPSPPADGTDAAGGGGAGAGGGTAGDHAANDGVVVGVDTSGGAAELPEPDDEDAATATFDEAERTLGERVAGDVPGALEPGARTSTIDPCAGRVAGAGPEAGCDGTGGVGGTVLAELDAIPLDIIAVAVARHPECIDRFGNVDEGEYPVVIASNVPAEFDVSRGEVGGPLGEPVHVSTSPRMRRALRESTSDLVLPPASTCVLFSELRPDTRIAVHVDGVNDAGFTDTYDGELGVPALRQRPPVEITPQTARQLEVAVPIKAGQRANIVGAVQGETAGCAAIERDGPPRPFTVASTIPDAPEEIPDAVRRADGYAYDPEYTRVEHLNVFLSERATAYDLCVFWMAQSRSFDPSRVVEREAHAVSRPATYVLGILVAGVEGDTTFDPRTLHVGVEARRTGGSHCQYTNAEPVAPGITDPPLHDCGSLGTATLDPQVSVSHNVGDAWRTREAALDVRRTPCGLGRDGRGCEPHVTEWFRVAIPGRTRGLCGSGAGSCPRSDSPGTVVLRLDYDAPDGPLPPRWDLANTGSYTPPETVDPVPPPYPQLDTTTASVTAVDPGPESVEKGISIAFPVVDRPLASATASVDTTDEPCLVDAARATATNPSDLRTLSLAGLCPGTTYDVVLTLTDIDGNTATYSTLPSRHPGPSFPWPAASVTTPRFAAPISFRLTATATEDRPVKPVTTGLLGVEWLGVGLDGQSILRFSSPAGRECLNLGGGQVGTGYHAPDETWPGIIHAQAFLRLSPSACAGDARTGFRYRGIVAVAFDEQVSLLRLLAGETVAFHQTVPFGETGTLDATLSFTMGA